MRKTLSLAALLLLTACAVPQAPGSHTSKPCDCGTGESKPVPVTAIYRAAQWQELPGWPGEGQLAAWPAWLQSCKKLSNRSGWNEVCSQAQALNPRDEETVRAYYEQYFQPFRIESSDGKAQGLVTGYYEPLLQGSKQAGNGRFPVYATPDDMLTVDLGELYPELKNMRLRGRVVGNKVLPYWSRADIEAGKAGLAGKELVWVDDPIELFFLQVQGSGRVRLEDGSLLRLGYAEQNGHPYKSIANWLIKQGEMQASEASMQSIQAWARANPARLNELLNANPSYVFFRVLSDGKGGPIGALNVPLTDGASVAVDRRHIELGSPLYLATTWPNDSKPLNRLVHAQDTGGAIRGPNRIDFFWGFGREAGMLAGRMKQQGDVWLLWPKGMPLPNSQSGDKK